MARVTIEDCLKKVNNRFELIHLAAKRVRQLKKGEKPLVECDNKEIVVALREIAAGKVFAQNKEEQGAKALSSIPNVSLDGNTVTTDLIEQPENMAESQDDQEQAET